MDQAQPVAANQAYANSQRPLKEHEKDMMTLIVNGSINQPLAALDIGCADGLFLEALSQRLDCHTIHGIEPDSALAKIASERSYRGAQATIYPNDVLDLTRGNDFLGDARYDVIITSGLLPFFENKDEIVGTLARYLTEGGMLFSFDSVNSQPVDLRYSIRPTDASGWSDPRYIYSLDHLKSIFENHLANVRVQRFELPFDLHRKADPYSTYSVQAGSGPRMIVTNHNVVKEQFFFYGSSTKLSGS